MKKIVLLTAVLTVFAFAANATIWTVSNNPDSPGQYTSFQMAVDSSNVHDTILVAGSPTSYGTVTLKWSLTLIGAGYNNHYGENTTLSTIYLNRHNVSVSASGSRIMGFDLSNIRFNGVFTGGSSSEQTIDDVVIERCRVDYIKFGEYYNTYYNNDTVRNCIIDSRIEFYYQSSSNHAVINNCFIHNNIFNAGYITSNVIIDLSTTYLKNNIFINKTSNVFTNTYNMVIENNIFYGSEPQGATNCAFNNNLTFMNNNNVIPGSNNVGSGNLIDVDPMFVDFPFLGGAFDYSYNFHLQSGSPALLAGTDGTDIGIYGGMLPFEVGVNPYIPQMMEVTLPSGSSVPAGGTLNVHFKAKKQD